MYTFSHKFDSSYVFKSEWIFIGNYAVPKMIVTLKKRRLFLSRTFSFTNTCISMSPTLSMTVGSNADLGVAKISSHIPFNLTMISRN